MVIRFKRQNCSPCLGPSSILTTHGKQDLHSARGRGGSEGGILCHYQVWRGRRQVAEIQRTLPSMPTTWKAMGRQGAASSFSPPPWAKPCSTFFPYLNKGLSFQFIWLENLSIHKHNFELYQWLSGKESACNVGDPGLIPGLGRSPGEGIGYPLQCSWASLLGQMVKNLPASAGDAGSLPGSGRSPGEGNGNPLQHSCLENPMDRWAWRPTVHGGHKQSDTTERQGAICTHRLTPLLDTRKSYSR